MSFSEKLQGSLGQSMLVGAASAAAGLVFYKPTDFVQVGSWEVPVPLFVSAVAAAGNLGSDSIAGLLGQIPYVGTSLGTTVDLAVVPAAVVTSLLVTNPSLLSSNPATFVKLGAVAFAGNMAANWLMPTNLSGDTSLASNTM